MLESARASKQKGQTVYDYKTTIPRDGRQQKKTVYEYNKYGKHWKEMVFIQQIGCHVSFVPKIMEKAASWK